MIIKKKPITPGQRNRIILKNYYNIKIKIKKLKTKIKRSYGRNNQGKITTRHKCSGSKKKYRKIDFLRDKNYILGKIKSIEYDPFRNCNISLVSYIDGEYRYILHNEKLKIGSNIISGKKVSIKIGNSLILKYIPIGTKISCVEKIPQKGAIFLRAAGSYGIVMEKKKNNTVIKFKNNKTIELNNNCKATIGQVDNLDYFICKVGKAGINVRRGIRPTVRGVAMNPIDHPHGGGEGKTTTKRNPVSYKGKLTKGFKTVKKKK